MKQSELIKELNKVFDKLSVKEQLKILTEMYIFTKEEEKDISDEVVQKSKERIRKKLFGSSK